MRRFAGSTGKVETKTRFDDAVQLDDLATHEDVNHQSRSPASHRIASLFSAWNLTEQQEVRVAASLQSCPPHGIPARLRMIELFDIFLIAHAAEIEQICHAALGERHKGTAQKSPSRIAYVDELDVAHARGLISPRQQALHEKGPSPERLDSPRLGGGGGGHPPHRHDGPPLPSRPQTPPSWAPKDTERPPSASYNDVPRFYFAEGKPLTAPVTLVGPTYTRHENPHLKRVDGVVLAGPNFMAERMEPIKREPSRPQNAATVAAMVPLAVMEDEDVGPFISRELGRINTKRKALQAFRRPSSGKSDSPLRSQVLQVLQRIVVQAFGLPRGFAFVILKKLCCDLDSEDGLQNVNATTLYEYYEKHLRFKPIVRRMFETLLSSGPSTASAAGTLAGAEFPPVIGSRRNFLLRDDFTSYIEGILEHHPGLAFLKQTTDFQQKYLETVVIRIFFDIDKHDKRQISWREFENSKLPDAFRQVDANDDINTVMSYFSYEHFYVLYCKFWELDDDRDLKISAADFAKYYPEGTVHPKIVERIFQGCGRKLACGSEMKNGVRVMGYEDFVWFCLAEEDKSSTQSIRYWFRILDLDGDGIISTYEIEQFFSFTQKVLSHMMTEGISFSDVMCQICDMINPPRGEVVQNSFTLGDLLRRPSCAFVALNMILSVLRFIQFEQRDPFVAHQERLGGGTGLEQSSWDRFARIEYDRMAAETDSEM